MTVLKYQIVFNFVKNCMLKKILWSFQENSLQANYLFLDLLFVATTKKLLISSKDSRDSLHQSLFDKSDFIKINYP